MQRHFNTASRRHFNRQSSRFKLEGPRQIMMPDPRVGRMAKPAPMLGMSGSEASTSTFFAIQEPMVRRPTVRAESCPRTLKTMATAAQGTRRGRGRRTRERESAVLTTINQTQLPRRAVSGRHWLGCPTCSARVIHRAVAPGRWQTTRMTAKGLREALVAQWRTTRMTVRRTTAAAQLAAATTAATICSVTASSWVAKDRAGTR